MSEQMTTRTAALTGAAALAMYDAAQTNPDRLRAAAAMAEVLRFPPAPKIAKAKAAAGPTDTLTAENLAATMKRMTAIVEKRSSIPICACVKLVSKDGRLTITGTDLDIIYVETLRAPDLSNFDVAVNAADLAKALGKAKGDVGLTAVPFEGASLTVVAGGLETQLPGLLVSDFPDMAMPEGKPYSRTLPSTALVNPLTFVLSSISTEETRYYLNGVYMHVTLEDGAPGLTFVATDGSRMMKDRGHAHRFEAEMPSALIPRKTVDWIVKHLGGDDVQVDIWAAPKSDHSNTGASQMRFTTARGELRSKMIDGNFPDYARAIPSGPSAHVIGIPDPKAFAGTVRQLGAATGERSQSVRLALDPIKGVAGSSRTVDGKTMTAAMYGPTYVGDAVEIAYNAAFLSDIVCAMPDDVVTMGFAGPNDPALFLWDAAPGRCAVLMPLRV